MSTMGKGVSFSERGGVDLDEHRRLPAPGPRLAPQGRADRRLARAWRLKDAQTGAYAVIQRFASSLAQNIHFDSLVLDGVSVPPDHSQSVQRRSMYTRGAVGSGRRRPRACR